MLIPVLPDIQKALEISKIQAGLLITAFSIPAAIAILVAGALSDRIGRKMVIIPAMLLYGTGGILAGLASLFIAKPFLLILVARVLQGIGAAGTAPVAMALAGDLFKSGERSKVMGILEASNGMGKVISPIAGAALGIISWKVPFFAYGLLAIPFAAAVGYLIKEEKKNNQKEQPGIMEHMGNMEKEVVPQLGTILAALWSGTIVLLNLFGFLFYLSDILEKQYKLDGVIKGLAIAGPVLAMAITSFLTGLFLQKHRGSLRLFSLIGLSLVTGSIVSAIFIKGAVFLYIAVTLTGVGNGLILPGLNLLITSAVSKQERGTLTSVYGSVRFLGVALGPPGFGLALKYGKPVMLIGAGILAGSALIVSTFFLKPTTKNKPGKSGNDGGGKGEPETFQPGENAEDKEAVALYLGSDPF